MAVSPYETWDLFAELLCGHTCTRECSHHEGAQCVVLGLAVIRMV